MSVNLLVLQNLFQERGIEHISRLKDMLKFSIYTQAKAKCSVLLIVNFADLQVRTILQCFSCLQLTCLAYATAKIRTFFKLAK